MRVAGCGLARALPEGCPVARGCASMSLEGCDLVFSPEADLAPLAVQDDLPGRGAAEPEPR